MKIVVFQSSQRLHGNTEILLDEALKALKGTRHKLTLFKLNFMNLKPCQDCGGCDDPCGKPAWVPLLDHGADRDRGQAGRVGGGRARDPRQDDLGHDDDVAKTAAQRADEAQGEVEQALGHPGLVHERARENEKRDGQVGVTHDPGRQLVCHHH
jgi:hypothetical protein